MTILDVAVNALALVAIPGLTWLFVYQFVKFCEDLRADREITEWHESWAYWHQAASDPDVHVRATAIRMQSYLQSTRPEVPA